MDKQPFKENEYVELKKSLAELKQLKDLIAVQSRETMRWDNQPGKFSLTDLDPAKIKHFVERAKLAWDTPQNALAKLELLKHSYRHASRGIAAR